MDAYIEELNREMVDVNTRLTEAYLYIAGQHPDNPDFDPVCAIIYNL